MLHLDDAVGSFARQIAWLGDRVSSEEIWDNIERAIALVLRD